ncbi:MAG: hypothetical protein CME43_04980 [Haliea sp.]|uniref:YbaY family lipoprotein n=1 Tax=Haliea sp. TaxID=1932666 RepID=UPI000C4BD171|nr:YbaY family lipoprotein [Haliea sp.]MBM68810.1 hypothetical protein [Haliea sp.]|tara:strand:+ start:14205 stop:15026 length:822 start_codon:yes stop_codon:yes gene_type:complete
MKNTARAVARGAVLAVTCLFAGALAGCGQQTGDGAMEQAAGVIEGSVLYRERMMLPPDAQLEIQLEDVSRADAPATVLAVVTQATATAPPWPFRISYDPTALDPRHRYGLRATVRHEGRLMFTSDTFVDAFAEGAPEIVLVRVPRSAPAPTAAASVLPAGQWQLLSLHGEPADTGAGGKPLTLVIDEAESRVAGFSGCNRYTGPYTLASGVLALGQLAVTRMACMEGADLEERYLSTLRSVDGFSLMDSRLQLKVGAATVAVFQPLDDSADAG